MVHGVRCIYLTQMKNEKSFCAYTFCFRMENIIHFELVCIIVSNTHCMLHVICDLEWSLENEIRNKIRGHFDTWLMRFYLAPITKHCKIIFFFFLSLGIGNPKWKAKERFWMFMTFLKWQTTIILYACLNYLAKK